MHEHEIDWLPGYKDSRPVRIGNAAYPQLQLDVFGWAMDALHCARGYGLNLAEAGWGMQKELLLRNLEELWQEARRGHLGGAQRAQHFVHSKVMCWVAFDRAISAIERVRARRARRALAPDPRRIHAEVCERGYDEKVGAFVQAYGEPHLDAATLLIPIVGFLPPDDPRVVSTTAAIERELMRDGLCCATTPIAPRRPGGRRRRVSRLQPSGSPTT
jgi:GH15 family glucan-1,4-alpha-glucosidase